MTLTLDPQRSVELSFRDQLGAVGTGGGAQLTESSVVLGHIAPGPMVRHGPAQGAAG